MNTPPRWADRLLEWYCNPDLLQDLQGDLYERFNERLKRKGAHYAKLFFVIDVLLFIRPHTIRRTHRNPSTFQNMIVPNLRFGLRYLARQRFMTTVHLVGLTLGLVVCIVIFLFVEYEASFDKWYTKADRIYRINSTWNDGGRDYMMNVTPLPLAERLRDEVQGLEQVVLALPQFKSTVEVTRDRIFRQEHIIITEPAFVEIFDIEIASGDKTTLTQPYHALISQSIAKKFFGDDDPIGKSFRYRGMYDITVGGVFKDLPGNASLRASVLLSYIDDKDFTSNGDTWFFGGSEWTTLKAITYVVIDPKADPAGTQSKLDAIADKYINTGSADRRVPARLSMQPLPDIHFDAKDYGGGPWVPAIDTKWIVIFTGIGLAVLFLACVNFVNLSTAQAIVRSKEAGIRKTTGAGRRQLIFQFLTEPLLLVFASGVFAITGAAFIVDIINELVDKKIAFSTLAAPMPVAIIIVGLLFTALAAGWYPAWVVANANPVASLKPGTQVGGFVAVSWLRKTLVVFQFVVSTILITVVFSFSRQIQFLQTSDLGFQRSGIATVRLPDKARMQSFINKVMMIPGVVEASLSRTAPLSTDHWWNTMGKNPEEEIESVCVIYGDEQYHKVYDLKLLSGRFPSPNSDTIHMVVVNEKLIQKLNLGSPDEAIGKRFSWAGTAEIVGVVQDFNSEPLHYDISPAIIFQEPDVYSHASIRFDQSTGTSTLLAIESLWKNEFTSEPYEAKILDDEIHSYYKTESTTYTLFMIFAGIAILISCLGLLGLSVFTTMRRVKEISIRKALGASVSNILVLLSSQFMKVVAIACIVSLPLSWLGVDFLLGFYAFRIGLTWELLLLPMFLLIVVAFLTMLTNTVKASLTDPAKNLKTE